MNTNNAVQSIFEKYIGKYECTFEVKKKKNPIRYTENEASNFT